MSAVRPLLALLMLTVAARAADDRFGDPLPAGAVARCGTVRFRCDADGRRTGPVISPDGRMIAVSHDERAVHIWDATTGRVLQRWDAGPTVRQLQFSPTGKIVAVLGFQAVSLWDPVYGKLLSRVSWQGKDNGLLRAAVSPDGQLLATLTFLGELGVWQTADGKKLFGVEKAHADRVQGIAFCKDSKTLTSISDNTVCVWDIAGRKRAREGRAPWPSGLSC